LADFSFVASVSMEMVSSTLIVLRSFVRRRDLLPSVSGVVVKLGTCLLILLREINFRAFLFNEFVLPSTFQNNQSF
jgi:hypothetical protein